MTRTYEIKPRGSDRGFSMKICDDGEEMGGGIFSADNKATEADAYNEALIEAEGWIAAGRDNQTEFDQAQPKN